MGIQLEQTLIGETCIICGCLFAIPISLQNQRKQDHNWIYCPNGHPQNYPAETEAEILQAKLRQVQKERDSLICPRNNKGQFISK